MFQNSPFMTIGFQTEIPDQLKWSIMNEIKNLKNADYKIDYLQVFDLQRDLLKGHNIQKITHHQSQPNHSETKYLILPEDEIVYSKIFVIDEGEHHVFMLASEY